MTQPPIPSSVKKVDGGRIKGPADVPAVIEITCIVSMPNGKLCRVAFHGSYVTVPSNLQTVANGLFTAISSAWNTNLALFMPAGPPPTQFTSVIVRDMSSHLNPLFQSVGSPVSGTSAQPAMPASAAIAITENIATRGKGMKGRAFMGGWATNADAGGGLIASGVQTALNLFGTAVFNAIGAQGLTPVVAQVARQQYYGVTGTLHPQRLANKVPVTSYVCRDLLWDSQRRRSAG